MWYVYEVLTATDDKKIKVFQHPDKFECEVWAINHSEFTNGLCIGRTYLTIEEGK